MEKELAIVVPFYNEKDTLDKLVDDWSKVFSENRIDHQFILINDGSSDESLSIAENLARKNNNITLLSQTNSGHGAAILNGYRHALSFGRVFQIDADHQYATDAFLEMWKERNNYSFLVAQRTELNATPARRIISFICSTTVRFIFGKKITDINCPYRLMEAGLLKECLEHIPAHSFAPNVLMSAYIVKKKMAVFVTGLLFRRPAHLKKSTLNARLFKGSVQTFIELFKI